MIIENYPINCGYADKSIKTKAFETPVGEVYISSSGNRIEFDYSSKDYTFRNGLKARIHRIIIDTLGYSVGDRLEIKVGEISGFKFYDSDENTVMQEYHNSEFSISCIGFDTDYDFNKKSFYGPMKHSFAVSCEKYGLLYSIVKNASELDENDNRFIYAWIVCTPISKEFDVEESVFIELA